MEPIDRQAALDALNEQIEQCNKALGSFDISLKDEFAIKVERASLKAYKEQLENLPTVQPKRGKWIERNPLNSDKCRLIECDQCGNSYIVGFNVPYEHWIDNRKYCENCGADMRGEAE